MTKSLLSQFFSPALVQKMVRRVIGPLRSRILPQAHLHVMQLSAKIRVKLRPPVEKIKLQTPWDPSAKLLSRELPAANQVEAWSLRGIASSGHVRRFPTATCPETTALCLSGCVASGGKIARGNPILILSGPPASGTLSGNALWLSLHLLYDLCFVNSVWLLAQRASHKIRNASSKVANICCPRKLLRAIIEG